jgi:hypothetical protein
VSLGTSLVPGTPPALAGLWGRCAPRGKSSLLPGYDRLLHPQLRTSNQRGADARLLPVADMRLITTLGYFTLSNNCLGDRFDDCENLMQVLEEPS